MFTFNVRSAEQASSELVFSITRDVSENLLPRPIVQAQIFIFRRRSYLCLTEIATSPARKERVICHGCYDAFVVHRVMVLRMYRCWLIQRT